MFKINRERNARELRQVFVSSLRDMMNDNEKVVVFEADLGGASGSTALREDFSKQYIQAGISEANMIGMACGISFRNYIPFVHTFAPFTTRRALDQIYLSAYAHGNINIYGSDPGFCVGVNGGTHNTFEDISIMRNIPGSVVLAPADDVQFEWAMKEVKKLDEGIHYIRGNRKANPPLYSEDSTFELGKGNVLKEGSDVLILSIGELVTYALDAANELEKDGYSTQVIDMFSIKPFDYDLLLESVKGKKLILTFENHSIVGGLGSIVAETLADKGIGIKLVRVGTNDRFGQVGQPEDQRKDYGFTKEAVVSKIKENF